MYYATAKAKALEDAHRDERYNKTTCKVLMPDVVDTAYSSGTIAFARVPDGMEVHKDQIVVVGIYDYYDRTAGKSYNGLKRVLSISD